VGRGLQDSMPQRLRILLMYSSCDAETAPEASRVYFTEAVVSGQFFFLLRKHFITEKILKKKSGEVKDSVIFPFFPFFL